MTRTANDNNNINSRPTTDSNEKTWQKFAKGEIKPYLSNWKAPGCAKTTNSYKFNYKHHQTGPPPPCSSVKLGFLVHVVPLHPSTSKNIAESSRTHRMNTLCKPTDRNDSKRTKPYSFDSDLNFRLEPVIQLGSNWFCCAPAPSIPSADKKAWETRSQVVQPHFRRTIERSHTLQIDGRICYIMDIMLQFVFSIIA